MLQTLSGLFLVGRRRRWRGWEKRKRTNQENPRRVPGQIGEIPQKSGKSQKGQKRTKNGQKVQIGKPPFEAPPPFSGPWRKLGTLFRLMSFKLGPLRAEEDSTEKLLDDDESPHFPPRRCGAKPWNVAKTKSRELWIPTPGEKITKIIRPECFYVILGGGYGKNT